MTCAIIGGGAWGTTLAYLVSFNTDVILYVRDEQQSVKMQKERRNTRYLDSLVLPENVYITSKQEDISDANYVIFAVPSIGFRSAIKQFSFLDPSIPYISVTKGLERETQLRMSQVIVDADPNRNLNDIAVISGPNLAQEIAKELPSATVVASSSYELAQSIQSMLVTKFFRVYTSDDVIGCEIGGVTKNVAAIAAGIGDGFGYGDNAKATVMTRALSEITRFGIAEGGKSTTFSGLAGIGDLIATCVSKLSRNYRVGYLLGQGKNIDEINNMSNDIAEGVHSSKALLKRSQLLSIDMPIIKGVANVIDQGYVTHENVDQLMTRPPLRE